MIANKTKTRMKRTTLRLIPLNPRATKIIFCGAITLFTSFSVLSQEQNTKEELRTIQMPDFQSAAERQDWINKHPNEYQFLVDSEKKDVITSNEILPNDFPKYVNTGNPELDNQNYSKQKEKWIMEHPEAYKKMQEPKSTTLEIKNN